MLIIWGAPRPHFINLHSSSQTYYWEILSSPFYSRKNWSWKKLSDLPKVVSYKQESLHLTYSHLTPKHRRQVVKLHISVSAGFPSGSVAKNLPANARDSGSIHGSARSPGEGNSYPFQYSCLGNPIDRWDCRLLTVHGVTTVGHNWVTKQLFQWSFQRIVKVASTAQSLSEIPKHQ